MEFLKKQIAENRFELPQLFEALNLKAVLRWEILHQEMGIQWTQKAQVSGV